MHHSQVRAIERRESGTGSRRKRLIVLLAASLLATIPVWLPSHPAMADLPQHGAQVMLLRALHDPHFAYSNLFQTNWFTPYLFGYGLIYLLVPLVGIVLACKIVVSLALAAFPLSTALVMNETGADNRWALLTIPALYGITYQWGFLNFLVAAPAGMVFFAIVLRHLRTPSVRTTAALAVLVNFLFFCHALACAFFCLIAAGCVLCDAKSYRRAFPALAPLLSVMPILTLWAHKTFTQVGTTPAPLIWGLSWFETTYRYSWGGRVTGFIPRLLGIRPDPAWTVYGIVLFSLPLLAGARPSRRLTLWVPLLVCAAVLLFAPAHYSETGFIYARFTIFALPFFLIAFPTQPGVPTSPAPRGKRKPKQARKIAPAAFALWRRRGVAAVAGAMTIFSIVIASVHALQFDALATGFYELIARMQPGQRAVSLMFDPHDENSIAPMFIHFPGWYSAEKGGLVDVSFADFQVAPLVYRPSSLPAVRIGFEFAPQEFNWQTHQGELYRYFVARAPEDEGAGIFQNATCPIRLLYRKDNWWLYEKDPACRVPMPGESQRP